MKRSNSRPSAPNRIGGFTLTILALLVVLLVAVGAWFFTSHSPKRRWKQFTLSSPLAGDPTKPKPSAARQAQLEPKPSPAAPRNLDSVVPPPAIAGVPSPVAPTPTIPSKRVFANRKGFSNGCKHGDLLFTTAEITFTCPSDPRKSVIISPDNIKGVDDDGFELIPKGKYHFDIEGMTKPEAHTLFQQWLTAASALPGHS